MERIMPKKKMDFETALERIISISDKLENEEMKLEEAMTLYKEAVTLIQDCEQFVDKAERQIYIYREKGQNEPIEDDGNDGSEADIENQAVESVNVKTKGKKTRKKTKSAKSKTKPEESFELFSDIEKLSE